MPDQQRTKINGLNIRPEWLESDSMPAEGFANKPSSATPFNLAVAAHLQSQGWQVEREHLLIRGFPVQFLAAGGLTEEAVRAAERIDYEGVRAKVFRAEHLIAIAARVGRAKDKARIEQLLQQADLDKNYLAEVLQRHKLTLPTS